MNQNPLTILIPLVMIAGIIGLGIWGYRNYEPPEPIVFRDEEERQFWEKCVAEYASNMGRGDQWGKWNGDRYTPPSRPSQRDAESYADNMLRARRKRMQQQTKPVISEAPSV